MISIGQLFQSNGRYDTGNIYMLARTGSSMVALINLKDGNVWNGSHSVKNIYNVAPEEWNRIAYSTADRRAAFVNYNHPFTVNDPRNVTYNVG